LFSIRKTCLTPSNTEKGQAPFVSTQTQQKRTQQKRDRHRLLAQTEPVPGTVGSADDGVSATAGSGCCGSAGIVDTKPCHHDTSRIAWAKLLARVGEEFPLACPNCGGDIRLISFITDPGPIRKILTHLGEPLDPPHVSPARGPPVDWGELVQSQGAGEFEQASPDDLPMIDIHHR